MQPFLSAEVIQLILSFLEGRETFRLRLVNHDFHQAKQNIGFELKITNSNNIMKTINQLKDVPTNITKLNFVNVTNIPCEMFEMEGFSRVDTLSINGDCNFIESNNLGSKVYLPRYVGNVTKLKLSMKLFQNELINWFRSQYSQLKSLEIEVSNDVIIPDYIIDEFFKIPFDLEEFKLIGFQTIRNFPPMKNLKSLRVEINSENDFHNLLSSETVSNLKELDLNLSFKNRKEIIENSAQLYPKLYSRLTKLAIRNVSHLHFSNFNHNLIFNKNLRELTLSDESAEFFNQINELNILKLEIGGDGTEHFTFSSKFGSLVELIVRNKSVFSSGNSSMLTNFPNLERLHFVKCVFDDVHKFIEINQSLKEIVFEKCGFENEKTFTNYSNVKLIQENIQPSVQRHSWQDCFSYLILPFAYCCCCLCFSREED